VKRALLALAVLCGGFVHAHAAPKRKVVVLEYRSGSSSLVGIGAQLATAIGKQTSLDVLGPAQAKAVFGGVKSTTSSPVMTLMS
jgi:hypothetical protein